MCFICNWNWLVILTAILALTSIYQARRSHKNSMLELRAYVSVVGSNFNVNLTNKWQPGPFELVNNGETPARDIVAWVRWVVESPSYEKFPKRIPGKRDEVVSVIHKGTPFGVSLEPMPPDESLESLIPQIKSGECFVFFWGRIEYKDVFGKRHYTNFRLHSEWTGDRLSLPIVTDPRANDAD
jgi:hypothetical protein